MPTAKHESSGNNGRLQGNFASGAWTELYVEAVSSIGVDTRLDSYSSSSLLRLRYPHSLLLCLRGLENKSYEEPVES